MWKRWLTQLAADPAPDHPPREVALAVLLLECARADFDQQPLELDAVRAALAAQSGASAAELDEWLDEARRSAREAVSLHAPIARLNAELSHEEKSGLMSWLWRVAAADGRIDAHEEHLLRKLADLLYIPHAEFIRTKLAVQGAG